MLTRAQVRQLVACPTCGKPIGKCCVDVGRRHPRDSAAGRVTSTNHRLRVRAAERRAYELRKMIREEITELVDLAPHLAR